MNTPELDGLSVALQSHFLNLFTMAMADTNLDPAEVEYMYQLGLEKGVNRNQIDFILNNPHRIRFVKPATHLEGVEQLYDLAAMLLRDGIIDHRETDLLRSFTIRFGFPEQIVDQLVETLIEEMRQCVPKAELLSHVQGALS